MNKAEMIEGQFQSHKVVKAAVMNRANYNKYRGWELPADENGSDEGYLVEYLDGGEPNHPLHDGYISWTPKKQFDNGYKQVDPKRALDHPHPLMKFFSYNHLPPALQMVSKPFCELAIHIDQETPDGAEKTVALRKLLESKDCAVRASI